MKLIPPKKKDWSPGQYQVGLFIRTPRGSVIEIVDDDADEHVRAATTRLINAMSMKKEDFMEKYGVDETGTELEKKAQEGCPQCGETPTRHGNVLMCPKHGSEPFEQKK